jgi:hypothetical protein
MHWKAQIQVFYLYIGFRLNELVTIKPFNLPKYVALLDNHRKLK